MLENKQEKAGGEVSDTNSEEDGVGSLFDQTLVWDKDLHFLLLVVVVVLGELFLQELSIVHPSFSRSLLDETASIISFVVEATNGHDSVFWLLNKLETDEMVNAVVWDGHVSGDVGQSPDDLLFASVFFRLGDREISVDELRGSGVQVVEIEDQHPGGLRELEHRSVRGLTDVAALTDSWA